MVPANLFFCFAFGYFLTFLFRVVNAVAGSEISAELQIGPADLGLLTSVYFLAFAAIQVPLGVLLDRYPPQRVQAALLVVAAAGALLFASGGNLATLTLGRALIGFGVSAGLMSAFKAYSLWAPAEKLPLVNGWHMAVGGLGVLMGGLPTQMAIAAFGWRGLFAGLAVLSVLGAAALLLLVPDAPNRPRHETLVEQVRGVGRVFISPAFLRLAPLSVASQATVLSVQSLWVGPWLRDVAGYGSTEAATFLSLMAVTTIGGYVACGLAARRITRSGVPLSTVLLVGCLAFLATQPMIIFLDPQWAVAAWLLFALFGTLPSLSYPVLGLLFPAYLTGRVHTALNFLVFVAAFAAQWALGVAVTWLTPAFGLKGSYDAAFWFLAAMQVAALCWYAIWRPARAISAA